MSQGGEAARSDLGGGVGWMVFGLAILAASWRMDRFESMGATVYTAPGFVPAMFGFALVLLGAVLAWRGWRARHAGVDTAPGPLLSRRIGLMLALTLAYAAGLVGRMPFWLATSLFVAAFTAAFADTQPPARRALTALASGVLTTLAVLIVFERIFLVRLP
ncbi:MAG: tripartite tricarboxylate transporter TctB family protein [Pseudomonadota bacterium]